MQKKKKKITRLFLQRQLFACVGAFGCVCVAYKYRLRRQRGDWSSRGCMPLCPPGAGAPNTGQSCPLCLTADSPTHHCLHQPGGRHSQQASKITKGLFCAFNKKVAELNQAGSGICLYDKDTDRRSLP